MNNKRSNHFGYKELRVRSRISAMDIERSGRWLEENPLEELEGWPVCKQYDVQRGEIIAAFPPEDFEGWDISWPLEEAPDLFLRFARIHEEPDFEQAALTFAYKYGLPDGATIRSPFTGNQRPFPDRMDISRLLDESRRAWIVLALYESVLNQDVEQARALISDLQGDRTFEEYVRLDRMEQAARTRFPPELELAFGAAVFVAKGVSDRLCTARISLSLDDAVELDSSCIRTDWHFDNLLGVIYLQMYRLITSGGGLTRCNYCGRMIAVSYTDPRGRKRRRDRRFCDDACRQAHHRSKERSADSPS